MEGFLGRTGILRGEKIAWDDLSAHTGVEPARIWMESGNFGLPWQHVDQGLEVVWSWVKGSKQVGPAFHVPLLLHPKDIHLAPFLTL